VSSFSLPLKSFLARKFSGGKIWIAAFFINDAKKNLGTVTAGLPDFSWSKHTKNVKKYTKLPQTTFTKRP
jgi:hypothetical protein